MSVYNILYKIDYLKHTPNEQEFHIQTSNGPEIECPICRTFITQDITTITNTKINKTIVLTNLEIHLIEVHDFCRDIANQQYLFKLMEILSLPSQYNRKRNTYEEFHLYQ